MERRTAVIIEDDPDVAELLNLVLTQSGYVCHGARNGHDGLELVREHDPVLTTLDVSMPGMDGFAVARRIRDFSSTYLIMITGLSDEIDVVMGLEAGADDYLVKPFRPRELRARAESMLRRPRARKGAPETAAPAVSAATASPPTAESWAVRARREFSEGERSTIGPAPTLTGRHVSRPAAQPSVAAPPAAFAPGTPAAAMAAEGTVDLTQGEGWVQHNGLALHPAQRSVQVDGRAVDLGDTEFNLLTSILTTGARVRSKADLVLTMRGQDYVTAYFVKEADKRAVEGHIEDLRRKLGDLGANPRFVEPVRGVGYRLAASLS